MSTIYTDPPQSRNEAIIKSTIDGTQYTDPPQSRMEDLLLDLKEAIEQGGGGTTVVANPEGEATDELEKLQVGSDIYEIPKDYAELDNKPQINGETLIGNKTASELGLQTELDGAQTVEGNPITITDAEAMNAENVKVELEPKQDLHGYDAPWVGGAGKNKLPLDVNAIKAANTTGIWSGNTYSINNGSLTIQSDDVGNVTGIIANGTFSPYVWDFIIGEVPIQNNIRLVGCPSNGDFDNKFALYVFDSGARVWDEGEGVDFDNSSLNATVRIVIRDNVQMTNEIFKPMITTDPTATYSDFEPYSNICPITGYSEVNVERVGKNLLDINASGIVQNAIFNPQTLEIVGSENYDISDYIEVKEGVTYKYSRVADSLSVPAGVFYDKDKNPISFKGNIFEMTIPSGIKYVRLELLKIATNQQLEVGSSKTTYEPYQGSTATISLGGTKYGGTLDVTEGGYSDEYVRFEFDGDEGWTQTGDTPGAFNVSMGELYDMIDAWGVDTPNVYCNQCKNDNNAAYWGHGSCFAKHEYAFFVSNLNCETVSEFITWLSNNPLIVVGKRKTPSSISTTPTDITLLENTNNISTNGTNIQLKYQPNNVIGECKAYTDEKCSEVLPPLPTTDGTYHLSCEVTSGVGVLSWVSDS